MKTIKIILFLITLTIIGCKPDKDYKYDDDSDKKYRYTDTFELRQLTDNQEVNQTSRASYFFIAADYSSKTEREDVVKVFAKVDGQYRFIKILLQDVRIKVNNQITKPYIKFKYHDFKRTNEYVINDYLNSKCCNNIQYIVIECPEKYLPEKLLPIIID